MRIPTDTYPYYLANKPERPNTALPVINPEYVAGDLPSEVSPESLAVPEEAHSD